MPIDDISAGLSILLTWPALLCLVGGVTVGFLVGVLPGLSTSNTAALLLPFSLTVPPEYSLIVITSIYAGAAFGGAVPAVLLNVPGEAGAAVTALDGYPMTLQGKGGQAIGIARMASVLGGVISGFAVLFFLTPLADLAIKIGSREMFVLVLFGFAVAVTLVGGNPRKGLIAGVAGMLLATVGAGSLTGQDRFTFGVIEVYEGIPFIPALIGLFAVSEMLLMARSSRLANTVAMTKSSPMKTELRDAMIGAKMTLKRPRVLAQSSSIGILLGVIPGIGTGVSNFVSYAAAKRSSKHPETFGKGEPDGVVASEACDNAVSSATFVPTMALGVPGSATMAVVLAALYLQGIQPGPQLLTSHGPEIYSVVLAMIVASLLILPLGIVLAAPMASVSRVPKHYLIPVVLVMCCMGAFASRNLIFDIGLCLAFGVVGYIMRINGYPVIPMVMGLILGPMLEKYLLRSLALGNDEVSYFFGSTTVNVLWALFALFVLYLLGGARVQRKRRADAATADAKSERHDVT